MLLVMYDRIVYVTIATLENFPNCISGIYDKFSGSHGKTTFQMLNVLRCANMSSIEATVTASQLRWTGHITSMNDKTPRGGVL